MHVIEIFKPGCYIPMSGACLCFSETDLQQTALAYDRRLGKAPLVIGHPADDRPAFGSVYGLVFRNSMMEAIVDEVDPAFAEAVNIGRFKKVSASFYTPTAPANPRPGRYYLKHVGFLGAVSPAVNGLADARFSECSGAVGATWVPVVAFGQPHCSTFDTERLAHHYRAIDYQLAHPGVRYLDAAIATERH